MSVKYACGKCGSTALYRDDDYIASQAYICCKICGNRYPGGFEPRVVKPTDRGTPEQENTVSDPGSARIPGEKDRPSNTIATNKDKLDQILDKNGGKVMDDKKRENTLIDLNNHLFAQMERLSAVDLTGEAMKIEIERSRAVTGVAREIVSNAALALAAAKAQSDGLLRGTPLMLSMEED